VSLWRGREPSFDLQRPTPLTHGRSDTAFTAFTAFRAAHPSHWQTVLMNGGPKAGKGGEAGAERSVASPHRSGTMSECVAVGQFSNRSVEDDRDAWIVLFLGGVEGLDDSTDLLAGPQLRHHRRSLRVEVPDLRLT